MVKFLHMNTLISKYDTDVFLGIDLCNKFQCEYKNSESETSNEELDKVIHFFKPINFFLLNGFDNEFNEIKNNFEYDIEFSKLLFEQYYVVKNTYKLLIEHINKTNTKYDLILRLRFDQYIWTDEMDYNNLLYNTQLNTILYNEENTKLLDDLTKNKKICFDEVNDNTIYLFGFGEFKHYNYANDQFFYHNHTVLDIMYNFYDNMIHIMKYCNDNKIGNQGALIECMFNLYLTKYNNIQIKQSNIKGIFIRERI